MENQDVYNRKFYIISYIIKQIHAYLNLFIIFLLVNFGYFSIFNKH